MSRITALKPEDATGETKQLFDTATEKMGGVPNVLRVMGNSPSALRAYMTLGEILEGTAFDAREREAIALTVAAANGCNYCASAHSAIAGSLKLEDEAINKHLKGQADDDRLQAVLEMTSQMVSSKGWLTDEDLDKARKAGLGDREVMDVLIIVMQNMLTNYTNHIAETEIDFPKVTVKD